MFFFYIFLENLGFPVGVISIVTLVGRTTVGHNSIFDRVLGWLKKLVFTVFPTVRFWGEKSHKKKKKKKK